MQIGIILSQTPGYSETFFNSKIKGLLKNGIDVTLYCQQKKTDFNLCPVLLAPKVTTNPLLQTWYFVKEFFLLLSYISTLVRYFKLERKEGTGVVQIFKKTYLNAHILKAKLDWLHFGFATQALGSETVAKAIGAKMAVSFRGFDINVYPIKHPDCYNTLWNHVDKVHSISHYLLQKAIGMGLSAETPSVIISPAVQVDTMPITKSIANSEHIKITTIARLTWIKGLDTAIKAMALLKENGLTFTYYIIGEGESNYTERYKFMVYELGLEDNVVFCGKMSHTETLEKLSTTVIYIQPSFDEGFCNAVLEAQALGILTVASNAGGLSENIVDGETGWVVPKYSPEALADRINKVVSLSAMEKTTIATNAQKRVLSQFNIERQEQAFINFYKSKYV